MIFIEIDKNTLNADVPEKFTFLRWTVYPPSTINSHMHKDSKSDGTYLLKILWYNLYVDIHESS